MDMENRYNFSILSKPMLTLPRSNMTLIKPDTSISEGIEKLYSWYICYTKTKYKVTFASWDEKLTQCF